MPEEEINLKLSEIAGFLCPKCKKKLKAKVRQLIVDQLADKVLGDL
jgi:hypothetical protein